MNSNDREADRPVFTPHQRATIEAATARIIPTDRDPGALEAGVIGYIEHTLTPPENEETITPAEKREIANFLLGSVSGKTEEQQRVLFKLQGQGARAWQLYIDGVEELDKQAHDRFGAEGFCFLQPLQQDRVLSLLEKRGSPFFSLLVRHTMEGFYGDPRHGGNRHRVAWVMLEFSGPSFPDGYQPPLGSYDAHIPDDFAPEKK
ncbi:MAG: gluconate 2-dehydrogenase subunit 3 family protein [Candidatus Binatia bacterium]